MKLTLAVLLILIYALPCRSQTQALRIVFLPDSAEFDEAAIAYRAIWERESASITAAIQSATGLDFEDREIKAIVLEVSSDSGYKEKPMHLRASYPVDTKKATLIHELGHRLQADLFHFGEDDHKYLFLWLYDVWVKLYGREFADAQVTVEKRRGRMYPADWDFALGFSVAERAAKWNQIKTERITR